MLYVAAKCETHRRFGATKLNKILFFADFAAYEQRGKSITGAAYQRLPAGPAPVELKPAEAELVQSQRAVVRTAPIPGWSHPEKRLVALKPPDLSLFDGEEIAIVDAVIDDLEDATAADVSEMTHRLPGWQLAKDGEEIPYFTAFLPAERLPLTDAERKRAEEVVARFPPDSK